jgi:outer membrane protein assembly factor BamB
VSPIAASIALFLSLAAVGGTTDDEDDWPSFRGHRARGVAEGYATPEKWSVPDGNGVAWRTPVPGLAHSCPIVWGDHVYVTTAVRAEGEAELSSLFGSPGYGAGESVLDEGVHLFKLYCLSAATGEVLWERTAHEGVPAVKRHPKSTHANSTPACDAERVVVFFGSEGLYSFGHDGELQWKRDLGVLDAGAPKLNGTEDTASLQWGFASSPVLAGDRVIVQCDIQDQSFVAALDAKTGKDLWRTDRDENPTWSTPTVHERGAGERAQVILNGFKHIGGYDLETGKELWKLVGGGDVPVPTPVVVHGLVFLTSAHGRLAPIYAIDVEAEGLLTIDPEDCEYMAWSYPRRGIYMQTPLIYGEELYMCSDGGILACFDAGTGEMIYRERLGDGRSGFSASAVAADGKLYFTGEDGTVHVVLPGPDFEVIERNDLGETCMATPAVSRGRLFFRTRGHVVAVGE